MNGKLMILTAAMAASFGLEARTVALWPLEADASGKLNGRCVVDWHNDLSCNTSRYVMVDSDLGWNLPPNPDPACHSYEPLNSKAIRAIPTSSSEQSLRRLLHQGSAGPLVFREKDFTVEGWVKLQDLPARDAWWYVVGCQDDNQQGRNRWQLSFRRRSNENYACSWIIWANGGSDKLLYAYESEAASFELTNTWIHVALVHGKVSGSTDSWTLFLNGQQVGQTQNEFWSPPTSPETGCFDIGARGSNANGMLATFDYWRISDEELTADKLLCAGGAGEVRPPSHTVAYWPLDVNAEGVVDGRDAVGDSPLTSGFHDTTYSGNTMAASTDSAFAGNPPNATVTLSGGNAGSLQGCRSWGVLQQATVGSKLNYGESFTVEGWIKPRVVDRETKGSTQEVVSYLFGTRPDVNRGWSFVYRATGVGSAKLELYAADQKSSGNVFINNAKLSGDVDVASWAETWHHVALVYDKTGGTNGYGLWTLYLDGTEAGSCANSREIVPVTDTRSFFLGGRTSTGDQGFQGGMDCFRVCQAALQPSQFLNAKANATAATNVIALWPLNVENGNYLDLRDFSGQGLHFAKKDDNSIQLVIADAATDGPVITNPDRSPTFRGSRTTTHGSCRFRNPDAAVDNKRAYLETGSSAVLGAMAGGKEFTFEFYYRHHKPTANVGDYQEVPLAVANSGTGVSIRFFRKATGFYIWESANSSLADTLFSGTSDGDLKYDQWYHIALVHSIEPVDATLKSAWRLYVDGVQKGDTAMTDRGTSTSTNVIALIGGRRWADGNSIIGNMSSVRLSSVALAPSDFLCANPVAPVPVTPAKTVAYWPIDNGSVGLGELLMKCDFVASGTTSAQSDKARSHVPNRTAMPEVTGAAGRNEGSVAVGASGVLTAPNVGFGLTFAKPFTLEGWVKMTDLQAAKTVLVETETAGSGAGVSLWVDAADGTPKLGLKMRDAWPATPLAEGLFDADLTPYAGVWTHFAVTYDPFDDVGTWKLYANGKPIASLRNFYRPNGGEAVRCGDFRLGSEGLSVDMWRLSSGVLEPSDFLYADLRGLFMVVR